MSDRPLPSFQLPALPPQLRAGNPGASPERAEPVAKSAAKPRPKLSTRSNDATDGPQAPHSPVSPDRNIVRRINRRDSRAYAEQLKNLTEHSNWEALETSPRTRSEGDAKQKPIPNPDAMRTRSEYAVNIRAKLSSFISVGDVGGRKRAHSNSPRPDLEPGKAAAAHVSKKQRTSQTAAAESSHEPANVAPAASKNYSDQLKKNFEELHRQLPEVCNEECLSELKHDLKSITKQLQQDGDASAANQRIDALRAKLTQLKEAATQGNDTDTLQESSRLINLSTRMLDKLRLTIDAPDQTDTAHADQATTSRKPRPGLGTIGSRKGSVLAPALRNIQDRRGAPAITSEPTPTPVSRISQPRQVHGSNFPSSIASDPSLSPNSMDKLCKEFFNDDEEALQSRTQEALDLLGEMDASESESSELLNSDEKENISRELDQVLNRNLSDKSPAPPPLVRLEKHSQDDFERITPPLSPNRPTQPWNPPPSSTSSSASSSPRSSPDNAV